MYGDDDHHRRPVRVPLRSPNDSRSASGRSDNASPEAFAREGYQILDRAEMDPFKGRPCREGIARPVYPGDLYGPDIEGDY